MESYNSGGPKNIRFKSVIFACQIAYVASKFSRILILMQISDISDSYADVFVYH